MEEIIEVYLKKEEEKDLKKEVDLEKEVDLDNYFK